MPDRSLRDVVSARIHALRKSRGMTQEQLCERAGVSLDLVSRIEGGRRSPSLGTLERLARALGVRVADLLDVGPAPTAPRPPEPVRRIVAYLDHEPAPVQRAAERIVREFVRAVREGGTDDAARAPKRRGRK